MKQLISWTVERDGHDRFVLWWWPRNDTYCLRNHVTLASENFSDAIKEAKYSLNIE